MSKQIANFELVIRGTAENGPVTMFKQYRLQETSDPEMGKNKSIEVLNPNFTKKFHDTNAQGELWYDLVAATKAEEDI